MSKCGLKDIAPEIKECCKYYGDGYCYNGNCSWKVN
jgi:hypothetical protein